MRFSNLYKLVAIADQQYIYINMVVEENGKEKQTYSMLGIYWSKVMGVKYVLISSLQSLFDHQFFVYLVGLVSGSGG